jgi:thiol-disulfide isomerase/thioredoxin
VKTILRALAAIAGLALIAAALFNFEMRSVGQPLLRLDTPKENVSPVDEGLNFSVRGLDGQKINLSQYRGHPVIVDFWATWCGPCRRQIPELVALYKRYNKSRGLVIIGMSCDLLQGDGLRAVAPFVEEFQINYPIALADERLVDSLGVEAIPTTLFVGPDGKIISRIVGAGRPGEISEGTRLLLEGSKRHGSPSKPAETSDHVVDIDFR